MVKLLGQAVYLGFSESRTNLFLACIILASMLMVSCGFTPRGSITQTTDIGIVSIEGGNNAPIAQRLKLALTDRKFNVSDNQSEAAILVRLSNEKQSQRIVSVESTGRVSEYELRHSVDMKVAQSIDGAPPKFATNQRANTVSVIREYTYDEKGVLGKADEANILRAEMREELVNHLMLRLLASVRQDQS